MRTCYQYYPQRLRLSHMLRAAILSAFFTICFMLPAYVASLTAILTVRPLQPSLSSWQDVQVSVFRYTSDTPYDLPLQAKGVPYGVVLGSEVATWLTQNSVRNTCLS